MLLKNYHVKPEQKIMLIRAPIFRTSTIRPISVDPLVKFLDDLPTAATKQITEGQIHAMKLAALDVLATFGKVDSDRLKKTLITMLKTDDPKTRATILQTIADARLTSATPILLDQLAAATDTPVKLALIRTLGQLSEKSAYKPLTPFIKSPDPAVRTETLRALAGIDYRETRPIAEKMLADEDLSVQRDAIVLLGQSIEGARIAGKAFADKKLPRSLLPEVSESLRRFASKEHPDVTELLSRVIRGGLLVSLEPAELQRVSALIEKQGDAGRGRKLFLNNRAVACITCHRLEGVGGSVGPDLTRVWDTLSLEKVMESMLDPSKEIKEGYQTYVATTKNGLTVSGLKVSQTAKELILRDPTGKDVRIAADDLEGVIASKKSLMPDDVVRHLSFGEFIDLVAFLRSRKSQEEIRGLILTGWAIGPFDADLAKAQAVEKNPNPEQAVIMSKSSVSPGGRSRPTWAARASISARVIGLEPASGLSADLHPLPQGAKGTTRISVRRKS